MESERISKRSKRIALIFILIASAANAVLTGVNVYLTVQFNQKLASFGFQNNVSNLTAVIMARADDSNMGKPFIYFSQEGVIRQTTHYGSLYAAVQVVTPHYGALTIRLRDFNVTESDYLSSERLNETRISYANEKESYVSILTPGLNQISVQLQFKAQVYLNSEKLPPEGESVQLTLGRLSLEAEAFDFETQTKAISDFSAEAFITLEMPQ